MNTSPKSAGADKEEVVRCTTSATAASKEGRVDRAFAHCIWSAMNFTLFYNPASSFLFFILENMKLHPKIR